MFASLVSISARKAGTYELSTMTPEELKAECDSNHGVVPSLHKMTIKIAETGEITEGCWASWSGVNRKHGMEITIQTAAGSAVHTFLTVRSNAFAVMS